MIYNDGDYSTLSGPLCVSNNQWWPKGDKIGYTACFSLTQLGSCQQHRIYLSTVWISDGAHTPGWDQALALHESGHALGLQHPQETSVLPPYDSNNAGEVMSTTVPKIDYLSTIDKNLIDGHY